MNYKEKIKTQLHLLKLMGKTRRDVEKDLKYSPKYLDQALSIGGSEKLFNTIVMYRERLEDQQNVAADDPATYVTNSELMDLQKQVIQDLRSEKLQWLNEKQELLKEKDELKQQNKELNREISILKSQLEIIEPNTSQKSKRTRSA